MRGGSRCRFAAFWGLQLPLHLTRRCKDCLLSRWDRSTHHRVTRRVRILVSPNLTSPIRESSRRPIPVTSLNTAPVRSIASPSPCRPRRNAPHHSCWHRIILSYRPGRLASNEGRAFLAPSKKPAMQRAVLRLLHFLPSRRPSPFNSTQCHERRRTTQEAALSSRTANEERTRHVAGRSKWGLLTACETGGLNDGMGDACCSMMCLCGATADQDQTRQRRPFGRCNEAI